MSADGFDLKPSKALKSATERDAILKGNLGFGRLFTEHMVTIRYSAGAWQRGELVPYGPLTLDPLEIQFGEWVVPAEVSRRVSDRPQEFCPSFKLIWPLVMTRLGSE